MMTVRDIIDAAGGPVAIAQAMAERGEPTTVNAVQKWSYHSPLGIPERHWQVLMALAGRRVTPTVLHRANELRRAQRKSH